MFRRLALNELNGFQRKLRMHLATNGPQTVERKAARLRKPPDGQHGFAGLMAAF